MKPSIGRIVHVIPPDMTDVHSAIITKVWSETCVNVVVFDCQGERASFPLTSCVFVDELKEPGHNWAWPPKV